MDHVRALNGAAWRCAQLVIAIGWSLLCASFLLAQTSPDSGAIYEQLIQQDYEASDANRDEARLLRHAREALTWYSRLGDERGQARSLVAITNAHYHVDNFDSTLINARRALGMLRRLRTDSIALADVLNTFSNALLLTNGPRDSIALYRAESVALFRLLPDRTLQGWNLVSHGVAFLRRSQRDAAFREESANLDSALHYLHSGVTVLRRTRDSMFVSGALGIIGNIWEMRNRMDSMLVYRRQALDISTRSQDTVQRLFDTHAILHVFSAPVRNRTVGITYNADSTLVWSRKFWDLVVRADAPGKSEAAMHLATVHDKLGKQDSTRYYLQRALTAARAAAAPHMDPVPVNALASWYLRSGFRDSAVALRREASSLATAAAASGTPAARRAQFAAWLALGDAHLQQGNADSALAWSRNVLAASSSDSVYRTSQANATSSLANQFLSLRRPDSAEKYFRQLWRLSDTPALRSYANAAKHGLGHDYQNRGDVDSALALFSEVVSATNGAARASALSALAGVELSVGQTDSALVHQRRALEIYYASVIRPSETKSLQGMGTIFRDVGMMDSSLAYLRRALVISTEDQERYGMGESLQSMASVFRDTDFADSAMTYARRALTIANGMDSPEGRATLFNNIGLTYLTIGQLDSSRVYLERALILHRANPLLAGEATTLANLGLLRLKTVVDDSVFALLRQSLALNERAQSKGGEVIPRLHLARAFASIGRTDSALVHARRALTLARAVRNRSREGLALAEIGRAFVGTGAIDSARLYLSRAVVAMRAAGFTQGVRTTLSEMAELFRAVPGAANLSTATAYYDSATAVIDVARRGAGGDDNEVALAESQVDVFGGWARAWIGRTSDVGATRSAASALGAVERGRAQSLVDMVTKLESAKRAETLVQYRPTVGSDLTVEVDSLLAPLRATRTAALSYLHAGDTLFTWLLTPSGTLELQQPIAISETELGLLVRSSRRALGASDTRSAQLDPDELKPAADSVLLSRKPEDDWKRLTELLLPTDLTAKVPAGTTIIVVPHGSIGLVPFAALNTRNDNATLAGTRSDGVTTTSPRTTGATKITVKSTALGARNPIRYAPSFAALRATELRPHVAVARASRTATSDGATAIASQALVVGNPAMPYVYSGRWTNRAQLRPLPGAEAESRMIATMLGARVMTGKAATETAVRTRMANAPLIHFATHGLAYGTSSGARRSYVAFAPDSAQDGLLTLGEIMDDPKLTMNAELVVLSACQTGLGNMKKAEGSIGLQRAFLAKGARSVLVSLWNVDDRATRLLMEKFYGYWLDPIKPRSKAEALQLAQNDVRNTKGFADPKYWAAFQLVGGN